MSTLKMANKMNQNMLTFFFALLFSLSCTDSFAKRARPKRGINLKKFSKPFCMIDRGDPQLSFSKKLAKLQKYQRKIVKQPSKFMSNKRKEEKFQLFGSPKWIVYRFLKKRGFSWKEIDFAYFALTLFGEARNLDEKSIRMVGKVINNRRKGRSYAQTVTELAQFSSWYYRNERDNVTLLCPSKDFNKLWKKIVTVAYKEFDQRDRRFKSTHYFAPHNMVPRYRIPVWAKGSYAVGYGGHIFLVDKDYADQTSKEVVYIPKRAKKIKIKKGNIYF